MVEMAINASQDSFSEELVKTVSKALAGGFAQARLRAEAAAGNYEEVTVSQMYPAKGAFPEGVQFSHGEFKGPDGQESIIRWHANGKKGFVDKSVDPVGFQYAEAKRDLADAEARGDVDAASAASSKILKIEELIRAGIGQDGKLVPGGPV